MGAYLVLPGGERVDVVDGMVLGRVKGCAVVLTDTKASRRHARLIEQGGVVEIEDMDSSNGTLLNGKEVTRRMLRDGDVVRIGKTEITYREGVSVSEPGPVSTADAKPNSVPDVREAEAGREFGAGEDLFGDEEPAPPAASAPVPSPPAAAPPRTPAPVRPEPTPASSRASKAFEPVVEVRQPREPGALAAEEEVLEFADDEVVTVKRSLPGKSSPGKPREAAPTRDGGVLQFQKVPDRGGLAGQDLSQMSGAMRLIIVLVALGVAAGLFWVAMRLAG